MRGLARAVVYEIVDAAVITRPTPAQAAGRARAAVWKLAESDCEGTRARQNPRWRRIATLAATAASGAARASPRPSDDDGIDPQELERWRTLWPHCGWRTQRADQPAVGNLSTLIKLLGVPSLRTRAIRDLHTIAASPLRAHAREVEEQAIPIARRLGSLLASADEGAVRCGAIGVAALARHDAIRASLFHAGDVERIVNLASVARPPSAPGGLVDWQREERKEASAQRACREATLRMKAARARAETQMKVAEKADDQVKQRLHEMEAALAKADGREADATSANDQADCEIEMAQDAESRAAGEMDLAGQSLAVAKEEQVEAENAATVAGAKAADATEAKATAEAAAARAIEIQEKADAALKAQQSAEAELAEAIQILEAGLVTDGERAGKKMNKQEKQDAAATVAAKQVQLNSAPGSKVDAPAEQTALDAAQADLDAAENKKVRKEAETVVAEKQTELQSAKSAGVARAQHAAADAKAKAIATRDDAVRQQEKAEFDKDNADARVVKAQEARKAAETVLADKKHALAKAVDELR